MERQNDFLNYRKKYQNFIYKDYSWSEDKEKLSIEFNFYIEDLTSFNPKITIEKKDIDFDTSNRELIDNIIFNIGLVELISYWKSTCSPNVIIECGSIDDKQINWFKKLYFYGLGELFYTNGINTNVNDFMSIKCYGNKKIFNHEDGTQLFDYLIPIGGGKDSCVTLDILSSDNNYGLIINPKKVTLDCAKAAKVSKVVEVRRTIDSNLLELNNKGFINGHTPFSAMLAFISTLVSYMTGKKYIALSNESSANESNVKGTKINHQYSKSFEFENDFRWYQENYLYTNTEYFSFLRPITEYQIGYLLSKLPKYHHIFKSCNVGSKNETWNWCCKCSKCLFVFSILSPFLYKDDLVNIFGKNLFEDKELLNTFIELIGYGEHKPFDCVGTYDEIKYAISKTIKKLNGKELPFLLQYYVNNYELVDIKDDLLTYFDEKNNNLNDNQIKLLKEALK